LKFLSDLLNNFIPIHHLFSDIPQKWQTAACWGNVKRTFFIVIECRLMMAENNVYYCVKS